MNQQENQVKNEKFKRTNLTWDSYMDYLIAAIDESKFMKRGEMKPMATPKDNLETHLTSRATHARAAANIARRIAKGLGLNHKYIYAGMLIHDAGHPFSAHEGEETFTDIGKVYNCQFFHHNSKGVEVIRSENICEKAISRIPNIKNQPELRKKLIEEFPYFLDIVISHDGEASPAEMYKKPEIYPDIETALNEKLISANAKNKYKFVAQTEEGRIAKFADVIAYLATDIQDGFRLGIYKNFPEQYLELFGEMFADDYVETKEEKIQIARNIINRIKEDKLRELVKDAKEEENKEIINVANRIAAEISESNIDFDEESEELNAILNKHIIKFKEQFSTQEMTEEDEMFLASDIQKIKEFAGKKLRVRSAVVSEVTSRMQEFFINDLLKNSKVEGELKFSALGEKLFFEAKKINYATYVPKTKWKYQTDGQPQAAFELVTLCAKNLINSGVIAHKFYDRAIRKYIADEEALKYARIKRIDEEKYEEYKKKHNIRDIKVDTKRYTGGKTTKAKVKQELFSNSYEYVQNEGETFATKYINTFKAIETQVKDKVSKAIDSKYICMSQDTEPEDANDFFRQKIDADILLLREKLKGRYGDLTNLTENQIQQFIDDEIAREREKMEEKMAIQLSIDYISGMDDRGFNEIAVKTGFLKKEELEEKTRVDDETAAKNEKVKELEKNMTLPSTHSDR